MVQPGRSTRRAARCDRLVLRDCKRLQMRNCSVKGNLEGMCRSRDLGQQETALEPGDDTQRQVRSVRVTTQSAVCCHRVEARSEELLPGGEGA